MPCHRGKAYNEETGFKGVSTDYLFNHNSNSTVVGVLCAIVEKQR